MKQAYLWLEAKTDEQLADAVNSLVVECLADDQVYDFKLIDQNSKEIQWVGVQQTYELEKKVRNMINFMIITREEIVTFFLNLDDEGYMIEANDDFEWFEITKRSRFEEE